MTAAFRRRQTDYDQWSAKSLQAPAAAEAESVEEFLDDSLVTRQPAGRSSPSPWLALVSAAAALFAAAVTIWAFRRRAAVLLVVAGASSAAAFSPPPDDLVASINARPFESQSTTRGFAAVA